ncbi:MAG: glycoside hydrolase family 9 protein, partial [Oscillospiraceae bacterium]|nr:glycoside hydrolase family 9 protein [Oscillospiraceae bacterium]
MILVNHLGYDAKDPKRAVYQGEKNDCAGRFAILNEKGEPVYSAEAHECGEVAQWKTGYYWTMDFSSLQQPGVYSLTLETAKGIQRSFPFEIQDFLLTMRTVNAASCYFKHQRCTGEWAEEDSHVGFAGPREGVADLRGGWYDATGDVSVHLSHLSHGHVYNPQQTSLAGYAFLKAEEWLGESENIQYSMMRRRMLDEGTFGADFLMRMRAPGGTFFRSVRRSDALEHVHGTRYINFEYRGSSDQFSEKAATAEEEVIRDENYEVSLRSGGGLAIATLAAASRHYYPGTAFTRDEYLTAAREAWHYLEKNNARYTSNGEWNLLDEYCALLALVELYRATEEYEYLAKAEEMARRVMARLEPQGEGTAMFMAMPGRPFFHPSDEGMPVVALLEYAEIQPSPQKRKEAVAAAEKAMRWQLHLRDETVNPFGYPRFLYKKAEGEVQHRFFFPHDTAVAPWWQGDNARLCSLSAAARLLAAKTEDAELADRLREFAADQLNWIFGVNPFDSCMMEGYGRNHIQYFFEGRYDFINAP